MTRLLLALVLGGASSACALAAVGLVLYAGHPQLGWALQCFAAWGFAAGLVCGGLHLQAHRRPVQAPPALPAQALHGLVRAAVAGGQAPRAVRGAGTAAAPAPVARTGTAVAPPPVAAGPAAAPARATEPAETATP